jgi:tRNA dimethylallyltransferase
VAGSKIEPLLVIVGETTSGKSSLSLQLAQQLNGEIISADAWALRRRADIGTAKPTKQERQLVRHHLIDIIEPDDKFSAAKFKRQANQAIKDIASRGKLPIMVGGSGLYIDSVLYDYQFLPASDHKDRQMFNDLTLSDLIKEANKKGIDLTTVDTNNRHRLIRLIETNGAQPSHKSMRENTLVIGLSVDREQLKKRISDRVDRMLDEGLEAEVKNLANDYSWQAEALKGIAYHEWEDYFIGQIGIQDVVERINKDNYNLAKRQRTWFNRNKSIQWFITPVSLAEIVELITTYLKL